MVGGEEFSQVVNDSAWVSHGYCYGAEQVTTVRTGRFGGTVKGSLQGWWFLSKIQMVPLKWKIIKDHPRSQHDCLKNGSIKGHATILLKDVVRAKDVNALLAHCVMNTRYNVPCLCSLPAIWRRYHWNEMLFNDPKSGGRVNCFDSLLISAKLRGSVWISWTQHLGILTPIHVLCITFVETSLLLLFLLGIQHHHLIHPSPRDKATWWHWIGFAGWGREGYTWRGWWGFLISI